MEREWLDNALTVGMTPDEFWYGDPELYFNYSRVYTNKYKYEQQNVWQIGARMCQALQSVPVAPLGLLDRNALRQMPKYPDCPYIEQETEHELTKKEKEYLRQKFAIQMENWVSSFKQK